MNHATDRNLLFGILAVQLDFIRGDGLVRGMNAWILEKNKGLYAMRFIRGRSLGDAIDRITS